MNVHFASRLLVAALLLAVAAPLVAQNSIPCANPPSAIFYQPLPILDEIASNGTGKLSGTLYTVSEQIRMTTTPNGPGTTPTCFPQWVRAYRKNPPSNWNPPASQLVDPTPGPVLRARLGDVVQLTFLNVIDANKFPQADDGKCDETSNYPGTGPNADKYPDCFAGSVFTNVHYHGTHTNPNATGDNVFLMIRPSPRKTDGTNAPVVDASTFQANFSEFFSQCTQQLAGDVGPKEWPRFWRDLPKTLRDQAMDLLKQYQPAWYEANLELIAQGKFPQYFLSGFPYCFKLPNYTQSSWPPAKTAVNTPHTHGASQAEMDEAKAPRRPLVMGQTPGTHWYHAHKHGSTTINVSNGMTGVFVIEGKYDDEINAYYANSGKITQHVMVINQIGGNPPLMTGKGAGPGPDFSVNGRLRPTVSMKSGEVQMWRIANTSGRAGAYFIAPTGLQWMQLAQDGVQFNNVNYQASRNQPFLMASGNRVDLLVKAPAYSATGNNTYDVVVYNTVDPSDRPPANNKGPGQLTLVRVVVTNESKPMDFMTQAPSFPPFLADIADSEISGTQTLTYASSRLPPNGTFPSEHTIDGKKFDGEVGAAVGLNKVQEWKIVNATYGPANKNQISHPFHIHINPFQISELFDPNAVLSVSNGPGTVTTTNTSSVVTGSGTTFKSTFVVGDFIWINGEVPGTVVSIQSDTALTVNYAPGGVSAATYQRAIPQYTINTTPRSGQCVLNPTDSKTWKPCTPQSNKNGIWWDVFSIPSGNIFFASDGSGTQYQIPGYFKMRSRFVDYAGHFVTHCHILAHEDRGMMTVVHVVPLQTPYSHH